MFLLQDPFRKPPPAFIRFGRRVDSSAIFAKLRLCLLEQSARRNSPQQLGIVRRARPPKFRKVPGDVRTNRDRPLNARGRPPCRSSNIPQGRYPNVFRVPIPAFLILLQRIKRSVGKYPVLRRPDAG